MNDTAPRGPGDHGSPHRTARLSGAAGPDGAETSSSGRHGAVMGYQGPDHTRYRCGQRICCSGCGQVPANPIARAEMAMTWLLPGTDARRSPVERRFCRGCVPAGPVADVVCVRCGDGPLLTGELAGGDAGAVSVVQAWMSAVGWRLSGPVCPDCCVGELGR